MILGCRHRKTSFPITLEGKTYIRCTDCGKGIPYDWNAKRIVPPPSLWSRLKGLVVRTQEG